MSEEIDLGKFVRLSEVKATQVRRFDYAAIAEELATIGWCTLGKIKEVMRRHSSKSGVIWYNQVRNMLERLDSMDEYEVYVDVSTSPRLYRIVKKKKAKKTK